MAQTPTTSMDGLRVGVLGLGAIGSIFFTQLSQLALTRHHPQPLEPSLSAVHAFVKPHQLEALRVSRRVSLIQSSPLSDAQSERNETLVCLQGGGRGRLIREEDGNGSAIDVSITTLSTTSDDRSQAPLDVLLVALKSYDSAAAIEELRCHHAHLLRPQALVVLLQNGLGALPRDLVDPDTQDDQGPRDNCQWRLVHGVTFVGGRVEAPGTVVVSGLDVGMTYLAPMATSEDSTHAALDALRRLLQLAGSSAACSFSISLSHAVYCQTHGGCP
ncbi:hypothetical protein PINS_up008985 [Pythium insidiosum]|nr:hypothetical protein PINS_up008985 [Pythium insidiosum]